VKVAKYFDVMMLLDVSFIYFF